MPAPDFITLYKIEAAAESAFKTLLEAEELSPKIASDRPEFYEYRPRVEININLSRQTGHTSPVSPHYRADTWGAMLVATIITNTKDGDDNMAEHWDFVAATRDIMARSRTLLINDYNNANTIMPYHEVIDVIDSGTTPTYRPGDGYLQTQINYEIRLSIRPDAWPEELNQGD